MTPATKFLIGLAAVAAMSWIAQGPMGQAEAFVSGLENQARAAVAETNLPGIEVRVGRDPHSRLATLSGPADAFQREGQGSLKGLNDLVGEIGGVSGVRWADEPPRRAMPLLLEVMAATLLAYLAGVGIGWLFRRRPKREGFY